MISWSTALPPQREVGDLGHVEDSNLIGPAIVEVRDAVQAVDTKADTATNNAAAATSTANTAADDAAEAKSFAEAALSDVADVQTDIDAAALLAQSAYDEAQEAALPPLIQGVALTGANTNGTVTLAAGFTINKVHYTGPGRLRLYRTSAGRDADQGRPFTTPYLGGAGLLYDYLALGAETDLEPPTTGGSDTGTIFYRIDGGPVTATLSWTATARTS